MSTVVLLTPPFEQPVAIENTRCVFSPLDKLVCSWKKAESANTASAIRRGELLHKHLIRELVGLSGGKRRAARGRLIDEAVARLQSEGFDVNASRLLKIYAVAISFGMDEAYTLSASVLVEMGPLVRRVTDSEDYELIHATAAKSVWATACRDRLGRDAVRDAVSVALGREPRSSSERTIDAAAFAAQATQSEVAEFYRALPDAMRDYLLTLAVSDADEDETVIESDDIETVAKATAMQNLSMAMKRNAI